MLLPRFGLVADFLVGEFLDLLSLSRFSRLLLVLLPRFGLDADFLVGELLDLRELLDFFLVSCSLRAVLVRLRRAGGPFPEG